MTPQEALTKALSDDLTGRRQNALRIVIAALKGVFSAGEFRVPIRAEQEEIEERMAESLQVYRETGDANDLARYCEMYLKANGR